MNHGFEVGFFPTVAIKVAAAIPRAAKVPLHDITGPRFRVIGFGS
jgi:hypothetical protein